MRIFRYSNEVEMDALVRGVEELSHKLTTRRIPEDSGELKAICDSLCDQVCKLLESDHRIRLHRAPHDSAQNEVERTNAAIGEALTTGRPVEPPADPFHGLTA